MSPVEGSIVAEGATRTRPASVATGTPLAGNCSEPSLKTRCTKLWIPPVVPYQLSTAPPAPSETKGGKFPICSEPVP